MAKQSTRTSLSPKLPGDEIEEARRAAAELRVRLLTGAWEDDLNLHIAQHFSPVRKRVVGRPDLSSNMFASIADQLSVLHDRGAILRHASEAGAKTATALLTEAGYQSLGTELQRYTLGCREAFVRPTLKVDGSLLLRVITPNFVSVECPPEDPDLPSRVIEARMRNLDGRAEWYHDDLDIRDPEKPTYKVIRQRDGEDVTAIVREGATDWPAQFRLADGRPILPYATYHAARTGVMWNWRTGSESVDGTLTAATLSTWWLHCFRDAAWSQRWTMDAAVRGAALVGAGKSQAATVDTDPSSVMQFQSEGDRAAIGQWNPAIDPLTLGTALMEWQAGLMVQFGLTPADVQRAEGTAQSGYAISLNKSTIRAKQQRYAPQFERGDKHLLAVISGLTRGTANAIPEDGWSISYPGPPKSWDEIQADLEKATVLIAAGLMSKVDAYMELNPGVDREQAAVELKRIADENRALG